MLVVSGLGENGLELVKAALPYQVNADLRGKDVLVFNASQKMQVMLEEKLKDVKITIEDSDQKVYQNAFKISSALNFNKFKNSNKDMKPEQLVLIVVRGHPMESYSDDSAKKFAKYIAKATNYSEHKLKFTIRGWLGPVFKTMAEEKQLVDKNGQNIEKFGFYFNKNPIKFPKDKSIVAKMFVAIKDIDAVIKYISNFERAPTCSFFNPEVTKENKNQKRTEFVNKRKE